MRLRGFQAKQLVHTHICVYLVIHLPAVFVVVYFFLISLLFGIPQKLTNNRLHCEHLMPEEEFDGRFTYSAVHIYYSSAFVVL